MEELTELTCLALDAGQRVQDLPRNAQPDAITRRALAGFATTPQQAITRAAGLRASPIAEEDLFPPGQGFDLAAWQALTATADYRDYHRLLNIDRMLTALAPLVGLIADADLATELRTWLDVQPDLDPLPTMDPLDPDPTAADPGQPG